MTDTPAILIPTTVLSTFSDATRKEIMAALFGAEPQHGLIEDGLINFTDDLFSEFVESVSGGYQDFLKHMVANGNRISWKEIADTGATPQQFMSRTSVRLRTVLRNNDLLTDPNVRVLGWVQTSDDYPDPGYYYVTDQTADAIRRYYGI